MSKKSNLSYSTIVNQRTVNLMKTQKPIIGVDIGSGFVKMVQIKNNKIVKWGIESLPEGIVNQGRIVEASQLSEVIKRLIKVNKIQGDTCSVCISGNEIIVRELKLPEMDDKQIMDNIKTEITSFLPMKQEEYCIDYKILEYLPPQEEALGKLRIMVAAAPNGMVQPYVDTLKLSNLRTSHIDVLPNIAGKLVKQISSGNSRNIGIIDFGAYSTDFVVTKDGNYFLHKSITNGGDYLTIQVAKKFNIDLMEAEEYKKKVNFFENEYNKGENLFIEKYMDFLILDIERTMDFFKSRNNHVGLDTIYITGGGSLLKGLFGYLKGHFNTEIIALSDVLQHYRRSNDKAEMMAFYAQAIGATLREE